MRRLAPSAAFGALALLSGCSDAHRPETAGAVPGGDPARGEAIVRQVGCGACHEIRPIRTARGLVGPPLLHMGRRTTIAGVLANTPQNMVRWVQAPQAVVPGNAMPDMGLDVQQARDVAAYVEALR